MQKTGKCIILSAPSGAGKTTIVKYLLDACPELAFSVSATSRPPRHYEEDGVHYRFLSPDAFRKKIENEEFVEWEEVYEDRYYGTLKSEIDRVWQSGKHLVFDVDVVGGINLKQKFGEKALALFVEPPSLSVLEERLRKRKTEDEKTLKERVKKAEKEIVYANDFDGIIINDHLETACTEALEKVKAFLAR
jgi:guanylate kinase